MVSKQNKILACILTALTTIPLLVSVMGNKSIYIYSQFIFDKNTFLIDLLLSVIASIILLGILFLCRKSLFAKVIVLIPATLITLWVLFVFSAFSVGNFWKSETKDFESFSEVDASLEKEMKIAGLSLGDITNAEIEKVEDFEYSYNSKIAFSYFSFKGSFTFSEESYNEIKNAFLSAPEFHEIKYDEQETDIYGMTGCFVIDDSIPKYETETFVDEWYSLIIRFNDDTYSFYFDLDGGYNT